MARKLLKIALIQKWFAIKPYWGDTLQFTCNTQEGITLKSRKTDSC